MGYMSRAEVGTTFSPQQCEYLGFDGNQTREAFREILALGPDMSSDFVDNGINLNHLVAKWTLGV